VHAVTCEASHNNCMILAGIGQSRHGNVAVSDGLDLEDTPSPCYLVEGSVDSLQQRKDLRRLPSRAPRSKARDISKKNRRLGEKIGNRLGLVHDVIIIVYDASLASEKVFDLRLCWYFSCPSCFLLCVLLEKSIVNVGWEQRRHDGVGSSSFFNNFVVSAMNEPVVKEKGSYHDEECGCDDHRQNYWEAGAVVIFEFLGWVNMERVDAVTGRFRRQLEPGVIGERYDDFHMAVFCFMEVTFSNVKRLL
jgi:hypothetical protein